MKCLRTLSKKHGFTLAETLVTVAIITILTAIAIPGVMAFRQALKQTELDACARQIFLAAQDSLTGRKTAGLLPSTADDTAVYALRTDGSSDAVLDWLLPSRAIDPAVAEQSYMLSYNAKTGTMLEVYYAEHALRQEDVLPLSGMGKEAVYARKEAKIGYYNGGDIAANAPTTLPTPRLQVHNGNDLTATVSVPLDTLSKGQVVLTVSSLNRTDASKEFPLTLDAGGNATLTLDSLTTSENRFATLFRSTGILPGDGLRLTVKFVPNTSVDNYLPSEIAQADVNSLFASSETTEDAQHTHIVKIGCARHLQNLSTAFSGFEPTAVFSAEQTANIDWNGLTLQPIENANLASYNGRKLRISNLNLHTPAQTAEKSYALGLFGALGSEKQAASLSNIYIENPILHAEQPATSGVLAASLTNAFVTDCRVYASAAQNPVSLPYGITGNGITGGLIGIATNCTVKNSFVGLPVMYNTAADAVIGGLIGSAAGGDIVNCYAAIDDLSASGSAAMLLGTASSGTSASNCYAVGNILQSSGAASGFSGGTPRVASSYCAVTYLKADGKTASVTAPNGFTAGGIVSSDCVYLQVSGAKSNGATVKTYTELATVWKAADTQNWAKLTAVQSHPFDPTLLTPTRQAYPFPALREMVGGNPLPHYGSWPPPQNDVLPSIAYWERYSDGSYGLYGVNAEGQRFSTLKGNTYSIVETGYGMLVSTGQASPDSTSLSLGWDGNHILAFDAKRPNLQSGDTAWDLYPFTAQSLSAMKNSWQDAKIFTPSAAYLLQPRFAGAVLRENDGTLGSATVPMQIRTPNQLRSIKDYTWRSGTLFLQTHNIDCSAVNWSPLTGLGGQTFDGNEQTIAGLNAPLFEEIQYSGALVRNVRIVEANITISSSGTYGIFANSNKGTIQNCSVTNSSISATFSLLTARCSIAGFVGTNYPSSGITDCTVVNTSISSTGYTESAGFLIENSGTLTNCHVRSTTAYTNTKIISQGGIAAGFAIQNNYSVTISRCSAAATVTANRYWWLTNLLDWEVDEAAGFIYYNKGQISSCYANCQTSGYNGASGFAYQCAGKIINSYAMLAATSDNGSVAGFLRNSNYNETVSNCYAALYLSAYNISYGFAPKGVYNSSIDNCYYLQIPSVSYATSDAGQATSYHRMTDASFITSGSVNWEKGGISYPYTMSGANPFPQLVSMPHYGDWPALTLPPLDPANADNSIGIFHYEKRLDGQYDIIGAGVTEINNANHVQANNRILYGSVSLSAITQSAGFGLFVGEGFGNGNGTLVYMDAHGYGGSLSISSTDSLSFIPFSSALTSPFTLAYYPGNGNGKPEWVVFVSYDATTQTFSVQ